jgi:hypothetical protein
MNIQTHAIAAFWSSYLKSSGQSPQDTGGPLETVGRLPEAWGFGDSPEMADDLGRLFW